MKIAVLANCQGESMAVCINAMTEGHQAEFILSTALSNGTHDIDTVCRDHDLIFAQAFIRDQLKSEFSEKIKYFPSIVFPGFHPDMTFARGRRRGGGLETIPSPMVIYHSTIILYGYTSGKTADETEALFTSENFERLGYYDAWNKSVSDLLQEGRSAGMPLAAYLERWIRRGCFMHSFNHPRLHTMVDITRELLVRSGIPIVVNNIDQYTTDPMLNMSTWPIYTPLADRLDLQGDYAFNLPSGQGMLKLRQFIDFCYTVYSEYDTESLEAMSMSIDEVETAITAGSDAPPNPVAALQNPYSTVRREQFWKNAVAAVAPSNLDPVLAPKFRIAPTDKVATAGSCFAQHIARTLGQSGFNYFISEAACPGTSEIEAKERNYGIFSARYGNIYTVRQLLQLLKRIDGVFFPQDVAWRRRDGRIVDPFRPQIEPAGFVDIEALQASRHEHYAAVCSMLREMDVFVFTLGLTEGWRSRHDGAVFPLAPGVAGGQIDPHQYEFVNFTTQQVTDDLKEAIDRIWVINPACRVLLTVSPVPLIATYEPKHALVATTYSKAVLRTVAQNVEATYEHVDYFPSYEIITGSYNRGAYFDDDLRTVTEEGVGHVMKVFMDKYTGAASAGSTSRDNIPVHTTQTKSRSVVYDIVCDEEAIANL